MKRLLLASTCLMALSLSSLHAQEQTAPGAAQPGVGQARPGDAGEVKRAKPMPDTRPAPESGEAGSGALRSGAHKDGDNGNSRAPAAARPADDAEGREPGQEKPPMAHRAEPGQPSKEAEPHRAAEPKQGGDTKQDGEPKHAQERKPDAGQKPGAAPKRSTGEETPPDVKTQRKPNADPEAKGETDAGTPRKAGQDGKAPPQGDADRANRGGAARVEGRVKIDEGRAGSLHRDLVGRFRGEPQHIDVDIRVGITLPDHIRYRALPPEIISDYPEFRGYDYFVEEDDVVIVDPRSREVVEVIGGDGAPQGLHARGPRPRFGREQDVLIRRVITERGGGGPALTAPAGADIRPLPRAVADAMRDAEAYGYFIDSENRVIIVERGTREVVDIVD